MRRELLFSLIGFSGGFVAAAVVFWQPVTPSEKTLKTSAADPSLQESAQVPEAEPARRNLPGTARVSGGALATALESAPQAQGAAEAFHETIGKLKGMGSQQRQAAIDSLMKQLRAMGPEGMLVLRNFFRTGQDVKFADGYTISNGRAVAALSLRTALLHALGDWSGPEAQELRRDVLRSTTRIEEASIAIAQLEKSAPGEYRGEAIQEMLRIAEHPADKSQAMAMGGAFIEAMRQLKAAELLPAAEKFLAQNSWYAPQFANALDALPADLRSAALQRMFSNQAVVKNLQQNAWSLQSMNYAEPVVAQNVAQIFAASTDKRFRENFLQGLANSPAMLQVNGLSFGGSGGVASSGTASDSREARVARLQARAAFLESIAPQCDTPVLQERLQDAREALQKAIENPEVGNGLVRGGSGTLILNGVNTSVGGTTIISSGAIQVSPAAEKK